MAAVVHHLKIFLKTTDVKVVMNCTFIHFVWVMQLMKIACGIALIAEPVARIASGIAKSVIHVRMDLVYRVNTVVKNHRTRREDKDRSIRSLESERDAPLADARGSDSHMMILAFRWIF